MDILMSNFHTCFHTRYTYTFIISMYNFSVIHFCLLVYHIQKATKNEFNFTHEILKINKWWVGISMGGWKNSKLTIAG